MFYSKSRSSVNFLGPGKTRQLPGVSRPGIRPGKFMFILFFLSPQFWIGSPLTISGPETPKKSEKSLLGPLAPGPPRSLAKVSKKFGESGKGLNEVPKDFFETFSRLSGGPGPEAPRDSFQTFLGFRARRARETPVNGHRVPKFWETQFGSKKRRNKHMNNIFTWLSRDFWGILFMCFFSPPRGMTPKKHIKTEFCHPPCPGTIPQICLCVLSRAFFPTTLSVK